MKKIILTGTLSALLILRFSGRGETFQVSEGTRSEDLEGFIRHLRTQETHPASEATRSADLESFITNLTLKNNTMSNEHFKTTFTVTQSPENVFKAITNVRGWWSENILGSTDKPDSEFIYNYKDVHVCKLKIVEFVPDKKIVWEVLENQFNFTKDKSEWKGNRIVFELSEKEGKTQLDFTQIGLVPEYECYEVCRDAWTSYIQGSLKDLITTGKGKPNTKENDLNKELIEKWGLPAK